MSSFMPNQQGMFDAFPVMVRKLRYKVWILHDT